MDGSVVPDYNHGSAKVTEQMSEKLADLGMLDVFRMQHVIQATAETPRTDGQCRDDRNPITFLMMTNNGCLSPGAQVFRTGGIRPPFDEVIQISLGRCPPPAKTINIASAYMNARPANGDFR